MNSKAQLRRQAYEIRNSQQNKEQVSKIICNRIVAEGSYQSAYTVMLYLHCRSEVSTECLIGDAINRQKKLVIPFCTKDSEGRKVLGLWHFEDLSELIEGTWGIKEPPQERWYEKNKVVDPSELDLIVVPGVAFTRDGARLGNGAGYYDRLLEVIHPEACLLAICFEAQLLPAIPMEKHDVFMDLVVTEQEVYRGTRYRKDD